MKHTIARGSGLRRPHKRSKAAPQPDCTHPLPCPRARLRRQLGGRAGLGASFEAASSPPASQIIIAGPREEGCGYHSHADRSKGHRRSEQGAARSSSLEGCEVGREGDTRGTVSLGGREEARPETVSTVPSVCWLSWTGHCNPPDRDGRLKFQPADNTRLDLHKGVIVAGPGRGRVAEELSPGGFWLPRVSTPKFENAQRYVPTYQCQGAIGREV